MHLHRALSYRILICKLPYKLQDMPLKTPPAALITHKKFINRRDDRHPSEKKMLAIISPLSSHPASRFRFSFLLRL